MTFDEELLQLEQKRSDLYKLVSDKYKLMSKVNDKLRINALQSFIDSTLKQANELTDKIEQLRKQITGQFAEDKAKNPHNKSPYN